jgi:hypothetical protein
MNKLTLMDVKQSLFDERFQNLFPEHKDKIKAFLKDPGCGCNISFLKTLMRHKDRLQQYFPNKQILTPEETDVSLSKNEWAVINCQIDQMESRVKKYPTGKRIVAAARWKDRVTVVLNDVESIMYLPTKAVKDQVTDSREAKMNWRVVNTNKDDLIHELRKLPPGRKILTLTRWQDKITLIVNDLTVLF